MTSLFRTCMLALLGLAFAAFGVVHAANAYPGPDTLGRFYDALPTLAAVLSFGFAVLAIVTGLVLLAPAAIRATRRGPAHPATDRPIASAPTTSFGNGRQRSPRNSPARYEEPHEWPDEYEDDRQYAEEEGRYPGEPDGRNRRNGEFDERRRVSSYR
jgi:hypothetical protein